MGDSVTLRLTAATQFARAAGNLTLDWFCRQDLAVEHKSDQSPVTIADRQAEQHLRQMIAEHFPGDGILGEEFGETAGTSEFRWILDPIDGTKSFICGVPLYGTMVGVEFNQRPCIGAIHFPGLDEGMYAATGQGAWHYRGSSSPARAHVSLRQKLADCVAVTSDGFGFDARGATANWNRLANSVRFTRTWGDVYGYMLVATGRADIMVDPILNVWDAAAVMPIIIEAGGRFTDWSGQEKIDSGDAIATNGLVHSQVLNILGHPVGSSLV
jgi:histidinol-phosphatase